MTNSLEGVLRKYWGYDSFLPHQKEAMDCVRAGKDSIVVLPTGGGKSICFQAPAMLLKGLTVVVSPLLSLMKDQVDALLQCGIPAARLDNTMAGIERALVYDRLRQRALKLLYVSAERVVSDRFLTFLKTVDVASIAIDEAHCVSMWGHDFRPEYRRLRVLREALPEVPVGAYTATATAQVRRDIAEQLGLRQPEVLVGRFDRPNLLFRVRRRAQSARQVREILDRHRGESGIVYCIRRADVDEMCRQLEAAGYRAAPYHAGMSDADRKASQDSFIAERVETIVATIAFGMGIDKSNVRYVVHAGMPKSIEHYQQESGRGGRDGLEAECTLLFSGGDYQTWKSVLQNMEAEAREIALAKLGDMYGYCMSAGCRHRAIAAYFGQELGQGSCRACDICLGEVEGVAGALVIAQKILSSVIRQGERFGAEYTAAVLTGSSEGRILAHGHDKLSTYGILAEHTRTETRDWIEQLVQQECLERVGEYGVLKLTPRGRRVLKGVEAPLLLERAKRKRAQRELPAAADSWEGVDRGLFEALRVLRRDLARERGLPAYIVFGDAALRDMARKRPATPEAFLRVSGVGEQRLREYGPAMLAAIREYCAGHSVAPDAGSRSAGPATPSPRIRRRRR